MDQAESSVRSYWEGKTKTRLYSGENQEATTKGLVHVAEPSNVPSSETYAMTWVKAAFTVFDPERRAEKILEPYCFFEQKQQRGWTTKER